MGLPDDEVHHLGVPGDDLGQGGDGGLDALAGRDEAEGRQHGPTGVVATGGAGQQQVRRPVRDHPDPLLRGDVLGHDHPASGLGEHRGHRGQLAQAAEHRQLLRRRLGEHGVQGDDERLAKGLGELEHGVPRRPAEQPEFVLKHHHVDIGGREHLGGRAVAGWLVPRDCGQQLRPGGDRHTLVQHGYDVDARAPIGGQHGGAQVTGEDGDPAGLRCVRRDNGQPHPAPLLPERETCRQRVYGVKRCRHITAAGDDSSTAGAGLTLTFIG